MPEPAYYQCPWCGYSDVVHGFAVYWHPREYPRFDCTESTGTTQCRQCLAAGPSQLFALAYDTCANVECVDMYLDELRSTPWHSRQ